MAPSATTALKTHYLLHHYSGLHPIVIINKRNERKSLLYEQVLRICDMAATETAIKAETSVCIITYNGKSSVASAHIKSIY